MKDVKIDLYKWKIFYLCSHNNNVFVQVREQEKIFARHVRENVRRKKEEEKRLLERHIQVLLIPNLLLFVVGVPLKLFEFTVI